MADSLIINGVVYPDVPAVDIPKQGGGIKTFYNTGDANVTPDKQLAGTKSYGANGVVNGSIPNNGAVGGIINTKNGVVTVPEGYTTGGSIGIADSEKAKIIAGNIKSGVVLLGQSGSAMVVDTTIASGAAGAAQIISGYKAVANGEMITGTATVPTVSQDATTKVLTIM